MDIRGLGADGDLNFIELARFFGPKILAAFFCGGLIGLERELKQKAAGLKTNMLICLGSALFTAVSVLISSAHFNDGFMGDPGRVAAQIVSGIGFLGGGAIIQSRGNIVGLTTAATIWVVAAIGICIGLGFLDVAILATFMVILVLVAITIIESRFLGRSLMFSYEVVVEEEQENAGHVIRDNLEKNNLVLEDLSFTAKNKTNRIKIRYRGDKDDNNRFVIELLGVPGVRDVKKG